MNAATSKESGMTHEKEPHTARVHAMAGRGGGGDGHLKVKLSAPGVSGSDVDSE
jgi:hypothetical protein